MKENTVTTTGGINLGVIALGILAALLIFFVLTGRKVPLLSSDRAALLALIVIGMVICAKAGIGPMSASGEWWHPLSVAGYLLGALIVLIGIAALFGKQIPPLTSDLQSFTVVVVIALVKVVLSTIHRLL